MMRARGRPPRRAQRAARGRPPQRAAARRIGSSGPGPAGSRPPDRPAPMVLLKISAHEPVSEPQTGSSPRLQRPTATKCNPTALPVGWSASRVLGPAAAPQAILRPLSGHVIVSRGQGRA
jgi:hypothetical protein